MHSHLAELRELKRDYASRLQHCYNLSQGKAIHEQIVKSGLGNDISLGNFLVQTHGRSGSLEEARFIFNNMVKRNQHTWKIMLTAYARNGHLEEALALFQAMVSEGIDPAGPTIVIALGICTELQALNVGRWIHSTVTGDRGETEVRIGTALINMYGKCGSSIEARIVFNRLEERNVISWTSIISVYTKNKEFEEALRLYHLMDLEGIQPDGITLSKVLAACSGLRNLTEGKSVHQRILQTGVLMDEVLHTSLMSMYGKCGSFTEARSLFESLRRRSRKEIPWNAMISAYSQNGLIQDAAHMFREMENEGVKPDAVTLISLMEASCSTLEIAESVAARARWFGLEADVVLATALINMFGKCGAIEEALSWFDKTPMKNPVTWTTMITIYVENGHPELALELYKRMDIEPSASTYLAALEACVRLHDLESAEKIHAELDSTGLLQSERDLTGPLVTMYSKCGSLKKAQRAFERSLSRSLVSWTAMVAAFSGHGEGAWALALFQAMELHGLVPSEVSFTSILSGCSHSGLLEEGLYYFDSMTRNYLIRPGEKHFASIVDLLGRAGWLDMAELLVKSPACRDDGVLWTILLYSSWLHSDNSRAERIAERLLEFDEKNLSHYEQLARLQSLDYITFRII